MKRFRRMTAVVLISAGALCAGTLVFAQIGFATGSKPVSPFDLTSGTGFTITSTISSSSTSQIGASLYPGTQRYLWYTAHNSLKVPITVRTLSISSVTPPSGCPTSNLDYASTTFTGTLVVPAEGSNSVPVPISLIETHANQDSCENTTFEFSYQGSATSSVVTSTQTQLSSSHNPSVIGQPVTYTATVISASGSGNQHDSGSPTGTVTFKDGSTAICAGVPVSAGSNGSSSAACTPPTYLVTGMHLITAVFTNTDGYFSGSFSSKLDQVVQSAQKSVTVLTSWPNPSAVGFPVSLTATVLGTPPVLFGSTPSGTVTFYLGSPITSHSALGTEALDSNGKVTLTTSTLPAGSDNLFAVYNGDATYTSSTSPVIVQVVLSEPAHCDDSYNNWFYGSTGSSDIQGSSGNNFFWVPSGSSQVNGLNGITASGAATATTTTPAATAITIFPWEMATMTSKWAMEGIRSTSVAVTTPFLLATETAIT